MLRHQLQKYQHQQRLLFSTTRKRRRKPKLPSTTKDRLRRLTPAPPSNQNIMKIDGDLVAERMQTRLNWVRSNIESLWKDPNVTIRPDRYEVVMDGNWWKWNIILALTPAIFIATYCELVAKPKMLENRKDGSNGLPQPTSSSFLEDIYDGLMHYLYGMEPTQKIQPDGTATTAGSGSKSSQQSDLQQLQALKDQIQELEERMGSPRQRSGIRERHPKMSSKSREAPSLDSDSTSTSSGESSIPPPASARILQTLTESLEFVQEVAVSVLYPSPETPQENETVASVEESDSIGSVSDAVVNASVTHDDSTTSSSIHNIETPRGSSSLDSPESKEKEEDILASKDEFNKSRRRWWQLWK